MKKVIVVTFALMIFVLCLGCEAFCLIHVPKDVEIQSVEYVQLIYQNGSYENGVPFQEGILLAD